MITIPQKIKELIAKFELHKESYMTPSYNETQVRREFLDPFFESLGWDVVNRQGFAEAYKDVIHEDAIKIGGLTKAPDYCFRIGGTRKFFVEAKKPSVNIKDDPTAAFQLRRYAWSAKLPISILTDFEEFAIYDTRKRPYQSDPASKNRIGYYRYSDYSTKWEEIFSIFSREAILKGAFDKFAEDVTGKKGTTEVDDEFLKEIEYWRELLAKNIARNNSELTTRELNYAVQKTIDRIIFLRIAEDRGIENYGRLMALQNSTNVYERLYEIFDEADKKYNSGLFHFNDEKNIDEPPDKLTIKLHISDNTLKEIIKNLYYPNSPYEFSVFSANTLGHVYEQFLGKVIRLTEAHHAVIEEKPEVKKAGGVYYTPTYIVDYIVKHTVGKLLEGKTPKQVEKIKILDPACGSGSFLLGAYENLLNWHREYYTKTLSQKYYRGKNPVIFQIGTGDWRLTTSEKRRILLNNIFGVDIDSQAVEVTKLSLLLKVLEGESQQTLSQQLKLFHERALPDLGKNIKCGNSLIGPDFYQGQQLGMLDMEEQLRINAFDWQSEFPEIMQVGGFDAVIGNPPWGASFEEQELKYLRKKFSEVIDRMVDSYIYFIKLSGVVTNKSAPIGFIIPSTILNQIDTTAIRKLLLIKGVKYLLSLGQGIFGTKVLNTSTIMISGEQRKDGTIEVADFSSFAHISKQKALLHNTQKIPWKTWYKLVSKDSHFTFFVSDIRAAELFDKLKAKYGIIADILVGEIQRGISPDVVSAYIVKSEDIANLALEKELLHLSVSGSQIKRYNAWHSDQFIIYCSKYIQIKQYPNILKHLEKFKVLNTCKEVKEGKHSWYVLHRARNPDIFSSPKFIGLTTSKTLELIYDEKDSLYVTDAMYVFKILANIDPWSFMAILQSKLFRFLYRFSNQGDVRVIPQVKAAKLQSLPFPVNYDLLQMQATSQCCKQMLTLYKQLTTIHTEQEKTVIQRQIEATDKQIDQLVYKLYDLTPEEIEIVENKNG